MAGQRLETTPGLVTEAQRFDVPLPEGMTPEKRDERPPLPLNGLLHPLNMEDLRGVETFKFVTQRVIEQQGGMRPQLSLVMIENPYTRELVPRIIAQFRVNSVSEEQLAQLEEVARRAYGEDVNTTTTRRNRVAPTYFYPKTNATGKDKEHIDTTIGWYFGKISGAPRKHTLGMLVMREIGKRDIASGVKAREDKDWFTQEVLYDNSAKAYRGSSYVIELREGGKYGVVNEGTYQTDLAETIVNMSLVLAGKPIPDQNPGLLYDIYHEMNQIGLGPATALPGLERQVEQVARSLIIPLASPQLTDALRGTPKSVGLVGQVGTGKTQIIKQFLRERLGVMMVPISAAEFEDELAATPERRTIIPRIRAVAERVGKNVILIIEDLENLADEKNPRSKDLLNELAGLYRSGYRILWTSNHPEVFNPQLLEPERLGGKLIFCGLPGLEARKMILSEHLVEVSRHQKLPLFSPGIISETATTASEARERLLEAVAAETDGFTPRFLKDVVVEAISRFMYRIALEKQRFNALTEADLEGKSFIVDDWSQALADVLDVYDVQARQEEDRRLQKLVKPNRKGFKLSENVLFVTSSSSANGSVS